MIYILTLLAAAWAAAAPYSARWLDLEVAVAPSVEIVDHVLPGVVVIAVAGLGVAKGRLPLAAALLAVLGGLWMVMTHIPLVIQGRNGLVSMGAALWHTLPGVAVFVLAGVAAVKAWNEPEPV